MTSSEPSPSGPGAERPASEFEDPWIFRRAWNALHDACTSLTQDTPEPELSTLPGPVPEFVKLDAQLRRLEDTVNNNLVPQAELYASEFPPAPMARVSHDQHGGARALSRPKQEMKPGPQPQPSLGFGMNSILESGKLAGVHRSNQAECTAQEYQALLDGVKTFYPFTADHPNGKLKQTAKYIGNSQQEFGTSGFRPSEFYSEETLLFHPQKGRRERHQHQLPSWREPRSRCQPTFKKLHEVCTPSLDNLSVREDWSTEEFIMDPRDGRPRSRVKGGHEAVKQNEEYLQGISDRVHLLNQEDAQQFSPQTGPSLVPEVHSEAFNIKEDHKVKNSATTAVGGNYPARNCNQNNNVNINLTLSLQQQNDTVYSATPVVVTYSPSRENNNKLVPQSLSIAGNGTSRSRSRGPTRSKSSTGIQTELPMIYDEQVPQRPNVTGLLDDPSSIQLKKKPIVIGNTVGVTRLRRDDLQDYSGLKQSSRGPKASESEYEREWGPDEEDTGEWTASVMNLSRTALDCTGESMKKVLEVADEIVSNSVYLPDERKQLTREELKKTEDKLSVALMGLVGIPSPHRHEIYETTAENIEAIKDLSKGTITMLGSVLNWFTNSSGNPSDDPAEAEHNSGSEFLNKLRILASINSEIDPDSEVWKQFETEVGVYADAVGSAAKTGYSVAKCVSRKCSNTVLNYLGSKTNIRIDEEDESSIDEGWNWNNVDNLSLALQRASLGRIEEQPEDADNAEVETEEPEPMPTQMQPCATPSVQSTSAETSTSSRTTLHENRSSVYCVQEKKSSLHYIIDKIKPYLPSGLITVELKSDVDGKQETPAPGNETEAMCPRITLSNEVLDVSEGNYKKADQIVDTNNNLEVKVEVGEKVKPIKARHDENANVVPEQVTLTATPTPTPDEPTSRPQSARNSKIPVLKPATSPAKVAAARSRSLNKESNPTISLYSPKPVRASSVAFDNPIALANVQASPSRPRAARSVPPRREARAVIAKESESTNTGLQHYRHQSQSTRIVPVTAASTSKSKPLRASHALSTQPLFEVIDVTLQTKCKSQASNTNVEPAPPTLVRRYKSKTSYKQIMDEKKQYLAKTTGKPNTPTTYNYTSTVGGPATYKANAVPSRTNSGTISQISLPGSRTSCTKDSKSFINLN